MTARTVSVGQCSPAQRLDQALAQLRNLSNSSVSCSSLSSPPAVFSPGVISPVFSEFPSSKTHNMNGDQVLSVKTTNRRYTTSTSVDNSYYPLSHSEETFSSPISPLSSTTNSTGRHGSQMYSSNDAMDMNSNSISCTCCPYGLHKQQSGGDGYVTVRQVNNKYSTVPTRHQNGDLARQTSSGSNSLDRTPQYRELSPRIESPQSSHSSDRDMSLTRSRNVVTKKTRTITSLLPDTGENESLTISPEAIKQIKAHTESSNRLIKELQDQLKLIPQMQERIKSLKEDKRLLGVQLQNKSGVSSMRSVGVGDFDVDEEHKIVERVRETVMQQAPKAPTRGVGVGVYDVNQELYTQADMSHTIAEHVKRVREKEIQTWIQEAESEYNARKASTRSFGVGEKDIWDEENRLIKEKEMRTIVIGQQEKPSQRNVGLQVKPAMRDVCIEFSQKETKPLTRSCGFNVDVGDIIQEMSAQMEEGQTQQQQQQNSWTVQKHVIQRKFMEAMTTGRQEDLVNFITGLLKRQVRSVGTTVKPTTTEFGMSTTASVCERGVGDDHINVTVRPIVQTKDTFTLAKPVTRTQPTWTDLILSCDAGTNTQRLTSNLVERGINTSPPPDCSNLRTESITTTQNHRPNMSQYLGANSTFTSNQQDYSRSVPQRLSSSGSTQQTITETTVTERRSQPEIEMKYHSHVDRLVAPPPSQVELDITLPQELTAEEKTTTTQDMLTERRKIKEEQHRTEMHLILPGNPDSLKPLTVQMLPKISSGSTIKSSTHTLLAKGSPYATDIAVLDTSLSPRQSQLVSQTTSQGYQSSAVDRSRSQSMPPTSHANSTAVSSLHESSSLAQTLLSSNTESPSFQNLSLSPSSSSTKTVISEQTPYSTMKETSQVTESGGRINKETVIERTFSSGSKVIRPPTSDSSLANFDYFGTDYTGLKPKGHAERMQRYEGATMYSSTGHNVDDERNKTELHGNPLKSRYTIEEMSGGAQLSPSSQTSGSIGSESTLTRSSLKGSDSPRGYKKHGGVKFSDRVDSRFAFSEEFNSSCSVIQEHLQKGSGAQSSRVISATSVVQTKWFEIAGIRNADIQLVQATLDHIKQNFSSDVLKYIINLSDGNGNTAIHYAVSHGNYEITTALLGTSLVDVNIQNKAGYTPVMLAAICELSNDSERTALRSLIQRADVNMKASNAGQTALMLAISHGCIEVVKLLLEANCDVNLQDHDGSSALMCAAEHNNIDIVEKLLNHPDINVLLKDQDGSTALDIALENGHEEIAELLQKRENSDSKSRQSTRFGCSARPVISPRSAGARSFTKSSSSRSYTSRFV